MQRTKRTQHRTQRPQHRTKRPFKGQKGQNEAIQDKRAEGVPFWLCVFPRARVESRMGHARVVLGHETALLWIINLFII